MKIVKMLLAPVLAAFFLSGCHYYYSGPTSRSVHTYSSSTHTVRTSTHYGGGY